MQANLLYRSLCWLRLGIHSDNCLLCILEILTVMIMLPQRIEFKQVNSCNADINTRENDSKTFNLSLENVAQSMKFTTWTDEVFQDILQFCYP